MKKFCIMYILYLISVLNHAIAQKSNSLSNVAIWNANSVSHLIGADSLRIVYAGGVIKQNKAPVSDSINIDECALVVSLFKNQLDQVTNERDFNIRIFFKVEAINLESIPFNDTFSLSINYNTIAGKNYKAKDFYKIQNVKWASIRISKIISSTEFSGNEFYINSSIQGRFTKKIKPAIKPYNLISKISENKSDIHFQWNTVSWAESYDLEWTFKDKESSAPNIPDYRKNSTRVNLPFLQNYYQIPLIFGQGKIWFRVRAIGLKPDQTLYLGEWVEDNNPITISDILQFEQGTKTWQYQGQYAENGLRKDLVSYYDGSSRLRQTQTRLSTDGNALIITEPYYDHQGRQVIQSLPTPYKPDNTNSGASFSKPAPSISNSFSGIDQSFLPSDFRLPAPVTGINSDWFTLLNEYYTQKPKLQYIPAFNKNESGNAYDYSDFEYDQLVTNCLDPIVARPMSTSSGAGKYYSPNNDFNHPTRDFIPDAKSFPFIQTEFTPDNTGRIARKGKVGSEFQLGKGHDIKMFYSIPSQGELDRIFGNDVGFANHYMKIIAQDENGQLHVSYQNSKGQIIATALAGEQPSNLATIEKDPSNEMSTDLIQQSNQIEDNGASSTLTHHFFIEQNRTIVILDYLLDHSDLQHNFECKFPRSDCYDCPKKLSIRLTDDCGNILYSKDSIIGFLIDTQVDRCNMSGNHHVINNITRTLNKGSYAITKTLSIIPSLKEAYINDYIRKDTGCLYIPRLKNDCITEDICKECEYESEKINKSIIYKRKTTSTLNCKRRCSESTPTMDISTFELLIADVRPGGQYAVLNSDTSYKWQLSVFNTENKLRNKNDIPISSTNFNYTNPIFEYRNADGQEALIDIRLLEESDYILGSVILKDGVQYIKPKHITNLKKLASMWQDSWSESLVGYHPEYVYFEWNNTQMESLNYDETIKNIHSYDQARLGGFIPLDEIIDERLISQDPYFSSADAAIKNFMLEGLRAYTVFDSISRTHLNIFELIKKILVCNAPLYDEEMNKALLLNCIRSAGPISGMLTDEAKNQAWGLYRSFYLTNKSKLMDIARNASLLTDGRNRLNNFCIDARTYGCPICDSIGDPLKSILPMQNRRISHPACFQSGSKLPTFNTDGPLEADEIKKLAQIDLFYSCDSICPKAFSFLNLLNALVVDTFPRSNKFSTNRTKLVDLPPVVLSSDLTSNFRNRNSLQYFWNTSVNVARKEMSVTITDDANTEQAKLVFRKSLNMAWDSVIYFNCFKKLRDSIFYMKAYNQSADSMDVILFVNYGFKLSNCYSEIDGIIRELGKSKINIKNRIRPANYLCCGRLSPRIIIPPVDCNRMDAQAQASHRQRIKIERAIYLKDSLDMVYNAACLNPMKEHFSLRYTPKIYQYTLYYYDQAGNLIKTVPPKAVQVITNADALNNAQIHRNDRGSRVTPNHINSLSSRFDYNSLNQKIQRVTPDDGVSRWCYDKLGRVVLSQDANQIASSNEAQYILYDRKGRLVEGGIATNFDGLESAMQESNINYNQYKSKVNSAICSKTQVTKSIYDEAFIASIANEFESRKQSYLRNRISTVLYSDLGVPTESRYDHASHFDYDLSGNLKELVQDFKKLNELISPDLARKHQYKHISYHYDLLTGNVKEIAYQNGRQEQFYHWYEYDADNRLLSVETGASRYEPASMRDKDASYQFYLHGPVSRMELGAEKVQGIDLIYTINGWLKQINSPNNAVKDPGKDGIGNPNPKDVFGFELKYFNSDYSSVSTGAVELGSPMSTNSQYFNGNIGMSSILNKGFSSSQLNNQTYTYDAINRLTQFRVGTDNNYAMDINYDKNGNITQLNRKDGNARLFDQLAYQYDDRLNNRLNFITDAASPLPASARAEDLKNQNRGNYQYDAKGRLLSDASEQLSNMQWNGKDKLKTLTKNRQVIDFYYDALGRRCFKKQASNSGEYTVRDLSGNVIAEYEILENRVKLNHMPIYASTRIGSNVIDSLLPESIQAGHWSLYRGKKNYELKNQVGDINVIVSDRKVPSVTEYKADIRKATDYYPFGMIMPGRDTSITNYAYGFQGMETDDDLKNKGNSYSTEFRQYDPRVARWLSVDPMMEEYAHCSPYVAFDNNPISLLDQNGASTTHSLDVSFTDQNGFNITDRTEVNSYSDGRTNSIQHRVITAAVIVRVEDSEGHYRNIESGNRAVEVGLTGRLSMQIELEDGEQISSIQSNIIVDRERREDMPIRGNEIDNVFDRYEAVTTGHEIVQVRGSSTLSSQDAREMEGTVHHRMTISPNLAAPRYEQVELPSAQITIGVESPDPIGGSSAGITGTPRAFWNWLLGVRDVPVTQLAYSPSLLIRPQRPSRSPDMEITQEEADSSGSERPR